MQLNFPLDNLTIFSVLKIIFIQRSYRVLHLYNSLNNELENDFSSKITAMSHQNFIPMRLTTFDRIRQTRSEVEEPTLNILLMRSLSSVADSDKLNVHLRPNEVNLILLTAWNTTENQVDFERLAKSGNKFLIITNEFISSTNRLISNQIYSIPLQPFDEKSTERFIVNLFSGKVKLKGMDINIFMQHLPPKSMVTATDVGVSFTGPDGCLAQFLAKSLGAVPHFWSDIGILYPLYKEWINDPMVAPRLHYRNFHKEIVTRNLISSVNHT